MSPNLALAQYFWVVVVFVVVIVVCVCACMHVPCCARGIQKTPCRSWVSLPCGSWEQNPGCLAWYKCLHLLNCLNQEISTLVVPTHKRVNRQTRENVQIQRATVLKHRRQSTGDPEKETKHEVTGEAG